jgi:hypothetical protein
MSGIPPSFVFGDTLFDQLNSFLTTNNFWAALYTPGLDPGGAAIDKTADQGTYGLGGSEWATGELSSGGYTAGGKQLSQPTWTNGAVGSVGRMVWGETNPYIEWTGLTGSVGGALVYSKGVSPFRGWSFIAFPSVFSVSTGPVRLTWDTTLKIVNFLY